MHRFFIAPENISGSKAIIDKEQAWHMLKVLRLKIGDTVTGFDGQGTEYRLCLAGWHDEVLEAVIELTSHERQEQLDLCLVQGIAKGDKMDYIIRKAVELGVNNIMPLQCEHSVVHLDSDRAGKKTSRWQSIAREACKQCRRNVIPNVHQPHSWDELWGNCGEKTVVIMLYENEAQTKLRDVIRTQKEQMQTEKTMLLVGPEGGFSKAEVEAAQSRGVLMAGLGPRILRTETASLAALSIILYELGDLG